MAQHYAMWPSMNPNGPQTAKKGTKPFFTHAHTMPKTTSGIVCTCVKNGVVPFLVVCGPFRLILGHVAYCWATLDVLGGFRLCARFCALLAHFLAPKCRPVKDHILQVDILAPKSAQAMHKKCARNVRKDENHQTHPRWPKSTPCDQV